MKVRFDNVEYDMVGAHVNAMPTHFQVTILKGEATLDSIVANVQNCDEISVVDDSGAVQAIYRGYTKINAITTYDGNAVSVELLNTDLEAQLNNMANMVAQLQLVQNQQGGRIEQVAEDLDSSQATQDLAIEDLGEVVSELIPEEE